MKSWGTKMKVIVYGYGLMGKKIVDQVNQQTDMELVGVVSKDFKEPMDQLQYTDLKLCTQVADVIIDFSHPSNLDDVLTYACANKSKVVLATTGLSESQIEQVQNASKEIAIFQSYNTSLGVQMVTKILREVSKELYNNNFDIEIVEKHHNQKIDAPSGTAKLLYEVIKEEIDEVEAIYDRSAINEKRKKQEVGIQALRGGTIFGEHTIMFAGNDEVIEITHTALSKEVFVQGAINAARSLQDKDSGLFTLKTLY